MRTFVALILCTLSTPLVAQTGLRTFTSTDSAFQFKYSKLLVRCTERDHDESERGQWLASDSCNAYFPMMCNQEGSHTIACFAYDKSRMKDYPKFEAATFSVAEIADAPSQDDCLSIEPGWRDENPGKLRTTTIHGATFTIIDFSEVGMGNGLEATAYRRFYGGKCYQLAVRIATVSPASISELKFKEKKLMDVREHLGQALNSFKFIK